MEFGASALSLILAVLFLCLFPVIGVAVNGNTKADARWYLGPDATEDTYISGNTAIVDLDVEQGTPVNFTEVLFLKNEHSTKAYDVEISLSNAVPVSEFRECQMHVYENSTTSWSFVDTVDLTDEADTFDGPLEAGCYLRMSFEVNAIANAGESYDFRVKLGVS